MPSSTKRFRMEPESGESLAHENAESSSEEIREGSESEEASARPRTSRRRSARGAKRTKAPMDGEGCGCGGGRAKKCTCDSGCSSYGKKMDRNDALTPQEYLTACDLGIQGRSRSYIRARLDAAERLDLKCGKGSISQGEKCGKGPATKAQGPNIGVRAGQAVKGAGLGVLEAVKWTSGYNIGKHMATGMTGGKNEKASAGAKVGSVALSGLLLGPQAAVGAARRVGAFGLTDLEQHAKNQKKERAWRRSVGYRDSVYAQGFTVDHTQLGV